jgi:hypothetical protein
MMSGADWEELMDSVTNEVHQAAEQAQAEAMPDPQTVTRYVFSTPEKPQIVGGLVAEGIELPSGNGTSEANDPRRRRLALALDLLADSRFDALLEPAVAFGRLPEVMADLAAQPSKVMCQVIKYG